MSVSATGCHASVTKPSPATAGFNTGAAGACLSPLIFCGFVGFMQYVNESERSLESVTWNVIFSFTSCSVAVPVIAPFAPSKVSPAGSLPEIIFHANGAVPPRTNDLPYAPKPNLKLLPYQFSNQKLEPIFATVKNYSWADVGIGLWRYSYFIRIL